MAVCPSCGHESGSRFFCDRCLSLLPTAPQAEMPPSVTLSDGRAVDCSAFGGAFPAEPWTPITAASGDTRSYAVGRSWWGDLADVVARRAAWKLDVLAPVHVVPVGDGALVVAEALPAATRPLLDLHKGGLDDTLAACRLLERALTPLHSAGLVWLNFDPAGLLSAGDRVQIASLDLAAYVAGECPDRVRLAKAYSPPEAWYGRADEIGAPSDVFHVAIYAYYRLAGLAPCGFPGDGLAAFDFDVPPLRVYAPTLPPGVAPVIARGLAREPADRFPSVAAFVAALAEAVGEAHERQSETRPVRLDSGGATAIGRTHVAMGLPNQDALAILPREGGVLAMVADGVTLTRIGSGERASALAVEVLSRKLTHESGEGDIIAACLEASAEILAAALAEVPPGWPIEPYELMSTTLVLAAARGNEVLIACAGDSRAYLIAGGRVEQLTVDGDVRCVHLAAGWPPEATRDLGADAFALYGCLGLGEPGPDGPLAPHADRCSPRVRRWWLRPGDVLILCSDGLVEEGVYLEPFELPLLAARHQSATALAEALVAAAVSRHRDPSPWEPEGCGDDVTCVVLRANNGD